MKASGGVLDCDELLGASLPVDLDATEQGSRNAARP
jgi:hypothetical protein